MSLLCLAASTQSLKNAATNGVTYPFTVGFWFNVLTTNVLQCPYSFNNGAAGGYHGRMDATGHLSLIVNAGSNTVTTTVGAATSNTWNFYLARFISATNRRLIFLNSAGLIEEVQGTASISPGTHTQCNIGLLGSATQPWNGNIAEWWYTNTDIQLGGAVTDTSLVLQLAYKGPFSVPYVAQNLVEYRSFRMGLDTSSDEINEVYWGEGVPQQIWTLVNAPKIGEHPRLASEYRRPSNFPYPNLPVIFPQVPGAVFTWQDLLSGNDFDLLRHRQEIVGY